MENGRYDAEIRRLDRENFSEPVLLKNVQITDAFWKNEMELVRTEVIPYQWKALNDRVEGAARSYCIHNFQTAALLNRRKKEQGEHYQEPVYTFRGFEALPEDPDHLEEKFYGCVFQDSDLYKWLEAVAYSLTVHPDEKLESLADSVVDQISEAQQENGYLDTYYIINGQDKIFTNLKDHHELYCLGHLVEAAVAYYQATGKRKILETAMRYADFAADTFGWEEGKCKGYPGHEIAEMALVRLYQVTGENRYLNLAQYFLDARGTMPYYFDLEHPEQKNSAPDGERYSYNQAHLPVREQDEAVGHAVRAMYLYSGMADMARLFEDEELSRACGKLWKNVTGKKLYVTGGVGAMENGEAFSFNYDLPNDTAYAETCAAIGLVFWARRMLQLKPDSKYADVMERALYNGVLSGMAVDGKSFFYVNPLEVLPEACHKDPRKEHVKPVRQKWFGCACCPPNLARLIMSLGSYAYTKKENELLVHLYMSGTVTVNGGTQTKKVTVCSGFPWNGKVQIRVEAEDASAQQPFTLALRIPGWGRAYTLTGAEYLSREEKDGYLYLTGSWKKTDTLEMDFPMEAALISANSHVREDIGKMALVRGPLVYCLEEADNGKDLHLLTASCDAEMSPEDVEIEGVKAVSIRMKAFRQEPSDFAALYEKACRPQKKSVTLRWIPYYLWANRGENEMSVWIRQEES